MHTSPITTEIEWLQMSHYHTVAFEGFSNGAKFMGCRRRMREIKISARHKPREYTSDFQAKLF